MARKSLIGLILAVSLAYAFFTYWPLAASFLPGTLPSVKPAVVIPAPTPSAVPTRETPVAQKGDVDLLYLPTIEVKAIDPFALRIVTERRADLISPPPEAEMSGTPASPAGKPAELKLEGVWVDSGMKVAFISGQTLSVGGKIMGWRVAKIDQEQVVLTKGAQTKILKVEER